MRSVKTGVRSIIIVDGATAAGDRITGLLL
jgi:hypothetical protein